MEEFKEDIQLDEENQKKPQVQGNENQPKDTGDSQKEQKIGERVNLSEFNFSKAAHPVACFFHTFFK